MEIIGIDCAAQDERIGLAFGSFDNDYVTVDKVNTGSESPVKAQLTQYLSGHPAPILIAIDAPLGWPSGFTTHVAGHEAGSRLEIDSKSLYYRYTDIVVRNNVGKLPLSVGADKIAWVA
jgi:hypothetical protein